MSVGSSFISLLTPCSLDISPGGSRSQHATCLQPDVYHRSPSLCSSAKSQSWDGERTQRPVSKVCCCLRQRKGQGSGPEVSPVGLLSLSTRPQGLSPLLSLCLDKLVWNCRKASSGWCCRGSGGLIQPAPHILCELGCARSAASWEPTHWDGEAPVTRSSLQRRAVRSAGSLLAWRGPRYSLAASSLVFTHFPQRLKQIETTSLLLVSFLKM